MMEILLPPREVRLKKLKSDEMKIRAKCAELGLAYKSVPESIAEIARKIGVLETEYAEVDAFLATIGVIEKNMERLNRNAGEYTR